MSLAGEAAWNGDELAQRREAWARFARKWAHRLPCDVRTPQERLGDWVSKLR